MFTKRNMLYLVVLLALFCIGIFTLHSQLLDSEERSHMFRTSSVLPEEIVKLYNYTEGYGDLNGPLVRQEDPRLVAKLATKFLIPPKHRDVPYHLEDPVVHDTSMGQAEKIMKLLNYKVSFQQLHNMGKISNSPVGQNKPGYVDVQCFPFYTYLLALNRTLIDYFSLDVEGNELDVLETIPFDKVDIQVRYWTGWTSRGDIGQGVRPGEILDRVDIQTLSVEFVHVAKGKEYLQMFMEKKGYVVDSEVTHSDNLANDFIFVKSTLRALDP
ncbi:unnamed protein product [Timema podura]|uniref:Methyltransferase FkbM domain-containing protein n=1 Tax=Timema podura TaxID=61482 RepID=A0ABN7P315_TIMPD|nr:unnamed protein product [Timema podura]